VKGWRIWALVAGALVAVGGLALLHVSGNPMLLVLGVLMVITAAIEPIYGRPNGVPRGSGWQPTDERFIDPESGKLVTVWSDRTSGERRYVAEGDHTQPPT